MPKINKSKYPELDRIANNLANKFCEQINKETKEVSSEMPYKAQYVLEEIIKILEERV